MLACKVFLSDKLLRQNNREMMAVIDRQAIRTLMSAGGDPRRILWMQEETSHLIEGYEEVSEMGRFRVYFEVRR